jgi:cytochrome c oxidase subunit 2
MNQSKRPLEAYALGFAFLLIVVLGTVFFFKKWLPPLASTRVDIDHALTALLIVTGIAFVATQALCGYFIWRYSDPSQDRAVYLPGSHTLEIAWTLGTALIFGFFGVWGLFLWHRVMLAAPPPNALEVEVTGQQFQWNFRYPGPDGVFGRTKPELISDNNPLGLDPTDPASKDDIVVQDDLYLPVNQPVVLLIRSKDVIHSFFLPNFRVKQDAVPGMTVSSWFIPTQVGDFDIACAQFCGLGHYTMHGTIHILPQEKFEEQMKELSTSMREDRKNGVFVARDIPVVYKNYHQRKGG